MRGSIPLYWNQDLGQRMIKPDIQLQCYDPLFAATRLHFQACLRPYWIILTQHRMMPWPSPRHALVHACTNESRSAGITHVHRLPAGTNTRALPSISQAVPV